MRAEDDVEVGGEIRAVVLASLDACVVPAMKNGITQEQPERTERDLHVAVNEDRAQTTKGQHRQRRCPSPPADLRDVFGRDGVAVGPTWLWLRRFVLLGLRHPLTIAWEGQTPGRRPASARVSGPCRVA